MPIINLTPHANVIVGYGTIPPSGTVARCATVSTPVAPWRGEWAVGVDGEEVNHMVNLSTVSYGSVEGLPTPATGVLYIVAALVRSAVPTRLDVASPGDLVRDVAGAVIGCRGLVVNGAAA